MSNIVALESAMPLKRRAERIRELMTEAVKDMLAIGAELEQARGAFPLGPRGKIMGWTKWLRDEFNISERYAEELIGAHRKFGHLRAGGAQVPAMKVLRFLARARVPESARKEVIERTAKGEKIGKAKAEKIVRKHLPTPQQAIEKARDTGKLVPASDGYYYGGASKEEMAASRFKQTVTYAIKDAITKLATLQWSPKGFLEEVAEPYQLWHGDEAKQIATAARWLVNLHREWRKPKSQREWQKPDEISKD